MNPIVVIPARMASTRLPGKPLADIHGKPMIVHVLDRGREAEIGPVAVACGDPEIAEAVRAAGGTAVMTDPTLPRGSDRVHAALAELDPHGRHDVVVNLQGDLPTIPPVYLRTVLTPLADPAFDIATLVAPIESDEEAATAVGREGGLRVRPRPRGRRRRCISPACRSRRATGRAGTISASTPSAAPRWRISSRCREAPLERRESLEQLRALEAGMRIACARVEHAPFGVDTPDDLERARRLLAPAAESSGARMTGTIAFQGQPGAYSDLACRTAYPDMTHAALRIVRDGDRGGARRPRRPGHAALREQPRRPRAGHPSPAAAIRPVRHRRAFPAGRALPAGACRAPRSAT